MENLDKDIEKIKISRMSIDERYLYNLFKKIDVLYDSTQPDTLYRIKDIIYFKYNSKTKDFFYNSIIVSDIVFTKNFKTFLYENFEMLLRKMVKNYLKLEFRHLYNFFDNKIK